VGELTEVRNIVPGVIRAYADGVAVVETPWFIARVPDDAGIFRGDVCVCIRPEHIIVLKGDRDSQDYTDTVVETEIVDEVATGSSHRLFMRTMAPDSIAEPFVFEVDVAAHPYAVLGIASSRNWRVVLSAEWMSLVPRESS
jgi:hypothetical protein